MWKYVRLNEWSSHSARIFNDLLGRQKFLTHILCLYPQIVDYQFYWVTAIPGNRWLGNGNTPGTSWPWPGTTSGVDLDRERPPGLTLTRNDLARERPSFPGNDLAWERPPSSTLTENDLPSLVNNLAQDNLQGRPWGFIGGTSRERCSRSRTAPGLFPGIAVTQFYSLFQLSMNFVNMDSARNPARNSSGSALNQHPLPLLNLNR